LDNPKRPETSVI